jgi:hypothetical protein
VKFDSIEDQFRAIFNYTQSGLGSPNNNGKLTYATTTDGVHFDVKDYIFNFPNSMYRSTMTRTSFADSCGAEFEMFYAPQWNIRRTLVFLRPRGNTSTYAYDNLSDTLFHVYSLRYRLSRWKGLPVARVVRKTDGAIRDVYPNSANTGLQLASGVSLQSWAGSDSLFVSRLYDQKGGANFVAFVNATTRPYLRPPGLTWPYTWAWQHFPTRNTAGISYYFKNTTIRGVTAAAQISSGTLWSSFASGYYFGFNAGNLTLLAGTNINYLAIPRPSVFTGVFGTAYIRQNRTVAVSGTTSGAAAANDQIVIGSRYSGATYNSFSDGIIPELVLWKLPPHATEVDSVEIRQASDYAYEVDSTLYDTYTATDGTTLSTRSANTGQSYSVSDANWAITSNQLGRAAAGSGLPTAVVDCGTTGGIIECTQIRGANGGSGPILRYVDQNNFVYLRIFNGTSLGLFRYVAGSLQTGSGVTIPLINSGQTFTWKIERIGNTFRVYTDGVLRMTLTETNFTSSTTVGFHATTSDTGVKWDALKVTPW